jgi:hypothetical protein
MNTIVTMLKSRTVWTVVAMFVIGGIGAVHSLIPAGDVVYVQGVLGLLAVYFKLNPSQTY